MPQTPNQTISFSEASPENVEYFSKRRFTTEEETSLLISLNNPDLRLVNTDFEYIPQEGSPMSVIDEIMVDASLSAIVEFDAKYSDNCPTEIPTLILCYVRAKYQNFVRFSNQELLFGQTGTSDFGDTSIALTNFVNELLTDFVSQVELLDCADENYAYGASLVIELISKLSPNLVDFDKLEYLRNHVIPSSDFAAKSGYKRAVSMDSASDEIPRLSKLEELFWRTNFDITTLDAILMQSVEYSPEIDGPVYSETIWASIVTTYLDTYFKNLVSLSGVFCTKTPDGSIFYVRKLHIESLDDLFSALQQRAEVHAGVNQEFERLKTIYKYELIVE